MPAPLEVESTLTDRYQTTVQGVFLDFLARDIAMQPQRLQAIDASLMQRLHTLTDGVEVDLHAVLSADNE